MSTTESQPSIDPQILADHAAVMQHVLDGTPVEPELARRVQERSQKLTEEIQRKFGDIDVNAILRSVRDE